MSLGEKIKERRRQLNLSQEKLAEKVHVHSNTIRKWEKGISVPDAKELQLLAENLGTTTTYLYGEDTPASFIKNSAYQDKTEILNSVPSMAYWGSLVDNAERTAENGKNLEVIVSLVKTALNILENAVNNPNELHEFYVKGCGYSLASQMMGK